MKYVSKCNNLVLTIKPNRNQVMDGIVITVPGEHVRFNNHEYETSDKQIIVWLKNHTLLGTAFTETTGTEQVAKEKSLKAPAAE